MNVNFMVNNAAYAAEMADIVDLENQMRSFDVVISCRNDEMELITNAINAIAQEIFNDFEVLVDDRVAGFMMFGDPAKYHYTIKGSINQIHDFRNRFHVANIQG
jgi:hypothetical protein